MGWLDKIASRIANELEAEGPDPTLRAELALVRGFVDRGDFVEAAARCDELVRTWPREPEVLALAGELASARLDFEAAVTWFGRAVDADPTRPAPYLALAQALLPLARFDPALEATRRVFTLSDELPAPARRTLRAAALVLRGRVALRRGDPEAAYHEFERALSLGADDDDLAADLGRALLPSEPSEGARWLLHAARAPGATDALVLEAARVQRAPGVAAALIAAHVRTCAPTDPEPRLALEAHGCLRLVQEGPPAHETARQQLGPLGARAFTQLAAGPTALTQEAVADLARAAAGLEDYASAHALAQALPPTYPHLPPQTRTAYALGTCRNKALHAWAEALAPTHPAEAARLHAALGTPPDREALTALVHEAPCETARRHWAERLAPAPAEDGSALALTLACERLVSLTPALASLLPPLARVRAQLERPLRVAIVGEFNAGKSSLVNALVGHAMAPVGVKPTTATLNVFRHGLPGAHVVYRTGRVRRLDSAQVAAFLSTLAEDDAASIEDVEIFMPHATLQRFEWIDTPGLNAAREAHERTTRAFMGTADVVVFVLSAQQAAKASERSALDALAEARTPVVALLNKTDQLEPEEVPGVHAAVALAFADRVVDVIDASLRTPAQAEATTEALLGSLSTTCEPRLPALKQRSALHALQALVHQALARLPSSPLPPATHLEAEPPAFTPQDVSTLASALTQALADLASTCHEAATAGAALSEDALARVMLRRLRTAFATLPAPGQEARFCGQRDVYLAQTRGRLEAAIAAEVAAQGPSISRDARRRTLERALPDPERFFWAPLRQSHATLAETRAEARARLLRERAAAEALHEACVVRPLAALTARLDEAWQALVRELPGPGGQTH